MECSEKNCAMPDNIDVSRSTPAERKAMAEILYKTGKWTMDGIAKKFGVSKMQISRDLVDCNVGLQLKPAMTASNPKGAGRPKINKLQPSRRKNTSKGAEDAAKAIIDEGKTYTEAEQETGLSNVVLRVAVGREEGRREPTITPYLLSLTGQQKLNIAVRQHKRKLETEFEGRVQKEYQDRLNEFLPEYYAKLAQAEEIIKARPGFMPRRDYRKVWACLHPDGGASKELLSEAFKIFAKLERVLVSESEMPIPASIFPRTYAEMMELKRKVSEARKAANRSRSNQLSPY